MHLFESSLVSLIIRHNKRALKKKKKKTGKENVTLRGATDFKVWKKTCIDFLKKRNNIPLDSSVVEVDGGTSDHVCVLGGIYQTLH